jgi:uncharacterized iron-regulated membrane protein
MNKVLYILIWRWHFFAGLYVVPFVLMLSVTGLLMLAGPWTDAYQYGDELMLVNKGIEPIEQSMAGLSRMSADAQLAKVKSVYPHLQAAQYVPPISASQSSLFKMRGDNFATTLVFVNPYNGAILGDFDSSDRWYSIADTIHGTLMLGKFGDVLIELSTGLTFLLLITGLYLYWPRPSFSLKALFKPSLLSQSNTTSRSYWKALHGSIGLYSLVFIVFFSLTGMAWTGIWGQQIVQPYSSFPIEKRASNWRSALPVANFERLTHGDLNDGQLNQIPWGLEQLPLPVSSAVNMGSLSNPQLPDLHASTNRVSLAAITQQGLDLGFSLNAQARFRIALPLREDGVYTLMSIASSRDVLDPSDDRTLHIDQYSAQVLADIGWDDYSLGAKTMALGIPLHQGTMGWWNLVLAVIGCLFLIVLSVSGIIMWWQRKPASYTSAASGFSSKLAAPIAQASMVQAAISKSEKVFILLCALVAIIFPVTGVAMLLFSLIEWIARDKIGVKQ